MEGTIIFCIMYIIVGLCVYTLFRGMFVRKYISYDKWENTNIRYKLPLWIIILIISVAIIPILNLIIPIGMLIDREVEDDREYYYKTFLTKRY